MNSVGAVMDTVGAVLDYVGAVLDSVGDVSNSVGAVLTLWMPYWILCVLYLTLYCPG